MSGSVTEAVFVLGEIERDLATVRRWLRDHADELTEAGVSGVSIDDASLRLEDAYASAVVDTAIRIHLQTMTRDAFAAATRVLMKGAGIGGVTKRLHEFYAGKVEPQVIREFGRVRVTLWCPQDRVCEPVTSGPLVGAWDCSGFHRLLAGATS